MDELIKICKESLPINVKMDKLYAFHENRTGVDSRFRESSKQVIYNNLIEIFLQYASKSDIRNLLERNLSNDSFQNVINYICIMRI